MIGTIIGDIVGSRFEWDNCKSTSFVLFTDDCFATDDSIMTLAIGKAIVASGGDVSNLSAFSVEWMQKLGQEYPNRGYGGYFSQWLHLTNPEPYSSFGNGAAMRVSAAGFAADSLENAIELSDAVTMVTHNHPEGIKGARATSVAIHLAKTGLSKEEIRKHIVSNYYDIDFCLDEIRPTYEFNETCQNTVPQALEAFFESTSFEDAIRLAISVGGDSDTLAAICGGVAQAYYGVPDDIRIKALTYLDNNLIGILTDFERIYFNQ